MSEPPAPLVPSDCDCADLDGFMLNVEKLMASELVALGTHEVLAAALFLWCRAWKQTPAASLPDDDRVNAAFARLPLKRFLQIKELALHGFVKCSDGRLYHKHLSKEAIKAFGKKSEFRERSGNKTDRQKRWRERVKSLSAALRELGVTPPTNASCESLETLLRDVEASKERLPVDDTASTGRLQGDAQDASAETPAETGRRRLVQGQGQGQSTNHSIQETSLGGLVVSSPPAPRRRRAKPRCSITDDAQPDDKDRDYARKIGLGPEQFRIEWRKFRDHHLKLGSMFADWNAAWRTWCDRIVDYQRLARAGPAPAKGFLADFEMELRERRRNGTDWGIDESGDDAGQASEEFTVEPGAGG